MRGGVLLLGLAALLGACNDPTYLSEHRPLETQAATAAGQMGFAADSDLFVLPVRRPTATERNALAAEQKKLGLMMPVPWAALRDFDIEIEYSVKNLDMTPAQAFVTLNGGNEFGDYLPMNFVDPNADEDNQAQPPSLLGGSPIKVGPGAIVSGVFREDQLAEAALDLEAITRYPAADVRATPFEVIEHDSTASRVGLENIPKNDVTPVMARFAFSLAADAHVVMDYTVRVRDHAGKLAQPTDKNLYVSTAAALAPPVMPPPLAAP